MLTEPEIPLFNLVICISKALDLISPVLVNHHYQVAYIAYNLGVELGLETRQLNELAIAGAMHDVGALSLREKMNIMAFEMKNPHPHAFQGYHLLKMFEPFSELAAYVQYHHVPWDGGNGAAFQGRPVPLESQILHLADRTAVLLNRQTEVLGQVRRICERIEGKSGEVFMPRMVDAFRNLSKKEYFWLDAVNPHLDQILLQKLGTEGVKLNLERLLSFNQMICRIIDFRSHFTATHSGGVAAVAEELARLIGFSERDCRLMRIAGYLHDLGKLAVPTEILEKPAKLSEEEFNVIRCHTYHTYHILKDIAALDPINDWASHHHERLNGAGYPFHLEGDNLSLGARIMAVADVFTALTEDRPYRKGMAGETALAELQRMAENQALDHNIVSLLNLHLVEINALRIASQTASHAEYRQFDVIAKSYNGDQGNSSTRAI
ncbi:MAG: HD domain-containing protein [Deltaproteobacteria bacterium]|nr:MAG: HD domain-containing protein [Deltaproteobacteria bacterium]